LKAFFDFWAHVTAM